MRIAVIRSLAVPYLAAVLVAACGESVGYDDPPSPPATPTQLTPPNGSVLSVFPRTTTLTWTSVPGATSYQVDIEYCQGQACVDGTTSPYPAVTVTTPTYTFIFVGAQPGRWRVAAVGSSGTSAKSGWWTFRYTS